jgi:saccharopine dehydrogenase (NAD+, L-lysine-forming)
MPGPDEQRRARTRGEVWGRASAGDRAVHITLTTPNPYDLTADSVLRAITRLGSVPPGVHTPSTAFGARYVTELDGVTITGPC